jgi:hypothetical protein
MQRAAAHCRAIARTSQCRFDGGTFWCCQHGLLAVNACSISTSNSAALQVGSKVRAEVTIERVSGNRVAFNTVCRLAAQPPTPLLDSQVVVNNEPTGDMHSHAGVSGTETR